MRGRHTLLLAVFLLACLPRVFASPQAEALLDAYGKSDVLKLLLAKCYGEVTINKPFPKQVYGRPPADRIDARTLAHDMERCKFSDADAHAFLESNGAIDKRREVSRVISGPAPGAASSSSGAGAESLVVRARRLERERERSQRKERRRRAREQQRLEYERQKAMTEEQREAEWAERECRLVRSKRDHYRKFASESSNLSMRQRYRELADQHQSAVRDHCKSVL